MAGPLNGLSGLYGPVVPHGQTGRAPSNWGGPPDREHALPGSQDAPRPQGVQYGPQVESDDVVESTPLPGLVANDTPNSHAAPVPRGLTQDPLTAAAQMRELHGLDLGGSELTFRAGTPPYLETIEQAYELSPNASGLAPVPGQLAGGPGGTDVDQGRGRGNSGTFGYGHQQRRTVKDPVPEDVPGVAGERPFYGRHRVVNNLLNGDDSPYGAQGDISTGMMLGPLPDGLPRPYEQPPEPTVQAQTGWPDEAMPSDYGWVAG